MLRSACWKSCAIFWATLLLAIVANPSPGFSQITVDADAHVGPTIDTWGWDIKGAVGRIGNAKKAKLYFQDTSVNLLRIPIDAHARFENGEIGETKNSGIASISNNKKMLASIRAAKLANPRLSTCATRFDMSGR